MIGNDGEAVLNGVHAALRRYCVLPSTRAEVAVTLWVAATHCTGAFEYAPRLVARSPEKRSGKSRLLEVIDGMVYSPLRAVNATVPYIFRSLAVDPPPTLLFDECDTIFGSKKVAEQNEDLRGLLNAGFQRGLRFGRVVGPNHTPTEFETFAMAALAGIGRMPDTIEDRAVVIEMRRRKADEKVAPYRSRRDRPALENLRDRLSEWADTVRPKLTGYEPPNLGVEDRAADVWEPLVAVADMAGGHWPQSARTAAKAMVLAATEGDVTESLDTRLLADIRHVFADAGSAFLKSADLCEKLSSLEESPWRDLELNPPKLGQRLRKYTITTGHNTAKTERGYRLPDFLDAFARYLPALKPSEPVQTRKEGLDQQEQADGLEMADGLNPSGESNPSRQNSSSDPIGTGVDGSGRLTGRDTVVTQFDPAARTVTRIRGKVTAKVDAANGEHVTYTALTDCFSGESNDRQLLVGVVADLVREGVVVEEQIPGRKRGTIGYRIPTPRTSSEDTAS